MSDLSQPELSEYNAIKSPTRQEVVEESERLSGSLPFYFFTVKYNYLIYMTSLSDRGSRRENHLCAPKHRYFNGIFSIFIETDKFAYSYRDKKWYFSSTKYPDALQIELTDADYIENLTKVVRKIYGILFFFPMLSRSKE